MQVNPDMSQIGNGVGIQEQPEPITLDNTLTEERIDDADRLTGDTPQDGCC